MADTTTLPQTHPKERVSRSQILGGMDDGSEILDEGRVTEVPQAFQRELSNITLDPDKIPVPEIFQKEFASNNPDPDIEPQKPMSASGSIDLRTPVPKIFQKEFANSNLDPSPVISNVVDQASQVAEAIWNQAGSFAQEGTGAIGDLFTEKIFFSNPTLENSTTEEQVRNSVPDTSGESLPRQRNLMEIRELIESFKKPELVQVCDQVLTRSQVAEAANLSGSFTDVTNAAGEVRIDLKAGVERTLGQASNPQAIAAEKASKQSAVVGGPDLRQASANEGGSALAATKGAN